MTLSVDVTMLKDSRGRRHDLTSEVDREWIMDNGFELDLPWNDRISGHPYVIYFQDFSTLFTLYKDSWENAKPTLVFNFFIPTSGWIETDKFGRFSANWRLREQQVDFLLSYFEHWDSLKEYNLVIGFCDESPLLNEIIEQIYDCINLYHIPKDQVKLMGHNFLGQQEINKFCKERKETPIKYITRWHMAGHIDFKSMENIGVTDRGTNLITYQDTVPFKYKKQYPIAFLNRRPSMSRACLLWGLFVNDVHAKNLKTISAFPPLRYFGEEKTDNKWKDQVITHDYMGHTLQKFQPNLLTTLNEESIRQFKDKMRVGKSVPGDYEFIGDTESQNIPFKDDFYVWVTCETVADMDQPNLFYTEKVLKPMVLGQGLIVYSQKHFVQRLKKLGFHTLGEEFGIDESYDDIDDDVLRMERVIKESVRIAKMDIDELHERWLSAKDKIVQNRKRMYTYLTNINNNFTYNLVNHIVDEINQPYNRQQLLKYNVNDELEKYRNFSVFDNFIDN